MVTVYVEASNELQLLTAGDQGSERGHQQSLVSRLSLVLDGELVIGPIRVVVFESSQSSGKQAPIAILSLELSCRFSLLNDPVPLFENLVDSAELDDASCGFLPGQSSKCLPPKAHEFSRLQLCQLGQLEPVPLSAQLVIF